MDWDKAFEEQAEQTRRAYDKLDVAAIRAKSEAEFLRGVRLGWWDSDGNPIPQRDDDDDEEDDEDDGPQP